MSEERFDRIESTLQILESGSARLRTDMTELRTDMTELRTDVTELRHYMGVIHEDLVDRLKASAMPEEQLRREWRGELDQLREGTDQRLRPLEVVVSQHSREIASLKKRRA